MIVLRARYLVPEPARVLEDGAVLVADGRIAELASGPGAAALAARSGEVLDLGDAALTAPLINAHAHLELSALAGRVSAEGGFGAWVGRLLAERGATSDAELVRAARRQAARLAATGHSWVGDIDSLGLAALGGGELGVVSFREVLDAQDPARTAPELARVAQAPPAAEGLREGISPHAPFTVSPALLNGVGELARARDLPVAIHWSETEAEVQWLATGAGPLAALLGPSPRTSGLDLIEGAGLLGPRTLLIHGNHPGPGEPERIAAVGATVVHCPGTHRFFGRAAAPLAAYREAGVRLALGTDSLASNEDLDLRREMAWLREAHPGLDPGVVFDMATRAGAQALGVGAGILEVGAPADLVAFAVTSPRSEGVLDELTSAVPAVRERRLASTSQP